MRADDDLYIQTDKLERFLRSLDHTKAYMIGQAGLGNTAEYGQLAMGEKIIIVWEDRVYIKNFFEMVINFLRYNFFT